MIFTEKIEELKEQLDFFKKENAGIPQIYSVVDFIENGDDCLSKIDQQSKPNLFIKQTELKIMNDTKNKVKLRIGEKNAFAKDVTKFLN